MSPRAQLVTSAKEVVFISDILLAGLCTSYSADFHSEILVVIRITLHWD